MSGPQSRPIRWCATGRKVSLLLALMAMLVVSGCSSAGTDRRLFETSAAANSTGAASSAVRPLRRNENDSMSARAVVAALALRGVLVPNPMEVTDQVCPAAGCDQSVVTDTMRVTSFSSPSAAARYAQERGLRHWHNIVVAFPPVMAASAQDQYWSAIVRIYP